MAVLECCTWAWATCPGPALRPALAATRALALPWPLLLRLQSLGLALAWAVDGVGQADISFVTTKYFCFFPELKGVAKK